MLEKENKLEFYNAEDFLPEPFHFGNFKAQAHVLVMLYLL